MFHALYVKILYVQLQIRVIIQSLSSKCRVSFLIVLQNMRWLTSFPED
jgi:hypothetical protein